MSLWQDLVFVRIENYVTLTIFSFCSFRNRSHLDDVKCWHIWKRTFALTILRFCYARKWVTLMRFSFCSYQKGHIVDEIWTILRTTLDWRQWTYLDQWKAGRFIRKLVILISKMYEISFEWSSDNYCTSSIMCTVPCGQSRFDNVGWCRCLQLTCCVTFALYLAPAFASLFALQ